MEIKIYKKKGVWGKHRQDRWGVIVEITNRDQKFLYMPTYKHLDEIFILLKEVEKLNEEYSKKEVKQDG